MVRVKGSIYGPKALVFVMQEIPEHLQRAFGIIPNEHSAGYHVRPNSNLDYEVIVLGDIIPDHIGRFILFHYTDDYNMRAAWDLVSQIESLNPEADWISFPVYD